MTSWYLLLVLPVAMLSGVMIWNSQIMETLESIVVKNPLAYSIWDILNNNKDREFGPVNIEDLDYILNAVKSSNRYCRRRKHMAMATGLVNGYTLEGVQQPHFVAETKIVKAGSDNGMLIFVPNKISICAGDSITWINNMGGPHNVVFAEYFAGVDWETINDNSQIYEKGDTFTMRFNEPGVTYDYYSEPHRDAGMEGSIVVM